jgi:GxxExxY protein
MSRLRIESPLSPEQEDLIYRVIGAAIEVHRQLGPGFVEKIYKLAMCHELGLQGISFECEKEIQIPYKEIHIGGQRLDLLVENQLILELKAVERLTGVHEAQIHSYMKATGLRIGLLINFNVRLLKEDGIVRIIR